MQPRARPGDAASLLATGAAVALLVVVVWVGLTAWTGKTYHLASLLVALAPGLLPRALAGKLGWAVGALAALIGFALAMAGWGVIVALGQEPTVTLVEGQPGGVFGEILLGAIIGALIAFATHVRYEDWVRAGPRAAADDGPGSVTPSGGDDDSPSQR